MLLIRILASSANSPLGNFFRLALKSSGFLLSLIVCQKLNSNASGSTEAGFGVAVGCCDACAKVRLGEETKRRVAAAAKVRGTFNLIDNLRIAGRVVCSCERQPHGLSASY